MKRKKTVDFICFSLYYLRNSPSGKQYIDNAKHKLIMKISLESIDLAAGKSKSNRKQSNQVDFLI